MPEVNVPIGTPVIKNIDGSMLDDSSYRLIDGYLDSEGNINSRPGLLVGGSLARPIDGIFWWDYLQRMMIVSDGNLFVVDTTLTGVNLSGTDTLKIGVRPTFATDGTYVYAANGGRIVQSDGLSFATYISDADAPTVVTHIINIDSYLMANKVNSQTFYWSSFQDPSTWAALDFASAEGNPDVVVAIHEFQKEIYIFGKESFELWQDDGQTPFSRVPGGYKNVGCIAPYSIAKLDNAIMWLSDAKRFVGYAGGNVEPIGTPFDTELDNMLVVSDCIADRININGRTFVVFTFPAENRTIVYNVTDKNWCEFGYWNYDSGAHDRFIGNAYAFSPLWNRHVIGSHKSNGYLFTMSQNYNTDDGNSIRMQKITGHISYGTNNLKRNESLTIRAKRGRTSSLTEEPVMMLRINDDEAGFGNEIQLSLGKMGDYRNMIRETRLGMYRTRQYEFTVTDNVGVAFGHAREDIYDMGR